MILPAVLYRVSDELFVRVMQRIAPVLAEMNVLLQISLRTDHSHEAEKAIKDNNGVLLLITCIDRVGEEGVRALQLGRLAISCNRDRYVIYCAHDSRTMIAMAPYCVRPAAIVTDAILESQAHRLFRDIISDYCRLNTEQVECEWITVRERSSVRRININAIQAVMAANKMVEIILTNETVVTYDSLDHFGRMLDKRFARCHRSCIVNTDCIVNVDFHEMAITLNNGYEVPLSRTFRQDFQHLMKRRQTEVKAGEA